MLSNSKNRTDRKAVAEGLRRGTAGALALILSAQLLFGNGAASAIAEELESVGESVSAAQIAEPSDASEQKGDAGVAGASDGPAADDSLADVSSEGAQDGAASADSASSGSAGADESRTTTPAATGTTAKEENPAVARAWDDATDNLVLSTDGMELDSDALGELATQIKDYVAAVVAGERDEDKATFGSAATELSGVELPSSLPVTLSVKATLDPTAATGRDGNEKHNQLLAGDTFEVSLPEGVTADLDSAALRDVDGAKVLDVYQADANGNATSLKVAEAVVGESKLSFKLIDTELPATLNLAIKLDAKLDSSKVSDEASAIQWVLQKSADRKTELSVPAKADVVDKLGLVMTAEQLGQVAAAAGEKADGKKSDSKSVALAASSSSTDTYEAYDLTGTSKFTTVFADNANHDGKRPSADSLADGYKLYYTVKNGDTVITEEAQYTGSASDLANLHLTEEQAANIALAIDSTTSNGQYVASASNLPKKIKHTHTEEVAPDPDDDEGQPTTKTETEYYTVTWTVKHDVDSISDDYQKLAKGAYNGAFDDTYYGEGTSADCYQLLADTEFTILVRDGSGALDGIDSLEDWVSSKFGQAQTIKTLKANEELATTAVAFDNTTATIYAGIGIKLTSKQVAYYPDNTALDYVMTSDTSSLRVNNDSDGTFDGYQIYYSNANVANHSSTLTGAYSGGTVVLTHNGSTKFQATKYWYDDASTNRPETTYSLYRYSTASDSSKAAQVSDSDGKFITFTVSADTNNAAGAQGIDLSQYVTATLAKYDPDGNPYVYFLREDSIDGYTRVAGTITEDESHKVSVSYNKAEYDAATLDGDSWGKVTIDDAAHTASSGNALIYNRGVISNVRTKDTTAALTKTWNAGAYQDQLKNVTVVMQLKRHALVDGKVDGKGASSTTGLYAVDDSWENVGDPVELTGWTSGNMSQTVSSDQAKYDGAGHEYVYQWCEVDVQQNGVSKFTAYESGEYAGITGTATLTLKDEQGVEDTVTFNGSYSAESEGGSYVNKTITNNYAGETYARATKYWNVDGKSVTGVEQPYGVAGGQTFTVTDSEGKTYTKTFPESLSFDLYQNETKFATGLKMDGKADDGWTEAVAIDGSTFKYRESSPWTLDFDGMPKYDSAGSKYQYQAVEQTPSGFSSGSSFSPSTSDMDFTREDGTQNQQVINYTSVSNSPYPGEGTTVRLSKEWIDGGNNTGRSEVTIEVYALTDVVKRDGTTKLFSKGDVIATATLNDANGWYKEVGISAAGGKYATGSSEVPEGFTPGGGNGFYYGVREVSNSNYEVITKDGATGDYADAALSPWADGTERLVTKDGVSTSDGGYVYDISYKTATDLQGTKIVTVNRRIGLVNITLSKTWVDEGADESSRPNTYYTIFGEGDEDNRDKVFFADADGNVYAQLSGDDAQYPLYTDAEHGTHLTTSMLANGSDFSSELRIQVTSDNASGFTVYGLPKYKADGTPYSFSASESMAGSTEENPHDYSLTNTAYESAFDSHLQHSDQKTYAFTNARKGYKSVTYFARWFDHYVKGTLNQRPDVYLTLYRMNSDGSSSVVNGYESYKWSDHTKWNDWDGLDPNYNQSVTISGLQKYDDNGKEIVYYATVTSSVSEETYTDLDYKDVEYGTSSSDNGNTKWDEHTKEDSTIAAAADKIDAGGKTALREDGTFIFKVQNSIALHGTKVWDNVPTDYSGELPAVSIFIQQRKAGASDISDPTSWKALDVSVASDGSGITGAGYDVEHYTYDPETAAKDGDVVAWTTLSGYSAANTSQSFSVTVYGENGESASGDARELPLYDSDGNRYEYFAREIMDGLIGKEGGFTLSELVEVGADSENNCYKGPTVETSGIGSSFRMKNTFKTTDQKGKLSVTKTFSGRSKDDKFPTVTFELYRAVDSKASDESAWAKIDEKTLDTSSMDASTEEGSNATGTVDFEGLPIYSPAGEKYQYRIVEVEVNGYDTYAAVGSATPTASDDSKTSTVSGLYPSTSSTLPETAKASYLNKYVSSDKLARLSGTKTWYDQSNASKIRPENITLKLKRSYDAAGKQADESLTDGEVVIQTTDSAAENYLSWTKDGNVWSYSIANLEKWAPNGQAWYYTISEQLEDGTEYKVSEGAKGGTAQASNAGAMSSLNFANYLDTSIGFTKTWASDGSDTSYQRPRVYIRLQARTKNGDAVSKDWDDAGEVLYSEFGEGAAATTYTDDYITAADGVTAHTLPGAAGDNVGKSTVYGFDPKNTSTQAKANIWKNLPLTGVKDGQTLSIEYRVVEIGYVYNQASATNKQFVALSVDSDGNYTAETSPYSAKQTDSTSVTNTLAPTSVSVSKTWNDEDNKWGLRADHVRYYLRRSSDGGKTWGWVSKYGADVADVTNTSEAIAYTVIPGKNWFLTAYNLPKADTSGNEYVYEFVEEVPTSYSVTSADAKNVNVDAADSGDAYTGLVSVGSGDTQAFENTLSIVTLTGTKKWETYGADKPSASDVKLTVYQNGKTDVTSKAKFEWTQTGDGDWTYTISGLPSTDSKGKAYTYKVVETAGAVDGYWPANPSGNATASETDADTLVNGDITNTATKFTFDKVDETGTTGATGAQLNGAEFTVKSGNTVVATWARDENGSVTVTVADGYGKAVDGYIVGLKAGDYTVSETKKPAGHVRTNDFTLSVSADGAVTTTGSDATVVAEEGTKVATVKVSNAVIRGSVMLKKLFMHGTKRAGIAMTFDLYKKNDDGTSVKIATGIKTLTSGSWTSKGSKLTLTGLGDYYKTLADGLPVGNYYFKETGTSPYTVKAEDEYPFTIKDNGNAQPDTTGVDAMNTEFNATAVVTKVDADDNNAGVDDAVFKLTYNNKAEGGDKDAVVSLTLKSGYTYNLSATGTAQDGAATKSDETGKLVINGLKKGTYTLTEISNKGYELNDTAMTITVTEDDYNKTLSWTDSSTLSNTRKTGSVTMTKTDGEDALAGSVFKLQVKNGDDWADVEGKGNLVTGEDGKITVDGLAWGTYRFVEVTPTAGYYGTATTNEVTINRDNVDDSAKKALDAGTVSNTATSLTLTKQSEGKTVTTGTATFTLTGKFAGCTESETREYSTTNGSVTITGELVVGENYTLQETSAPAGYELEKSTTTLGVNADGTFSLVGSPTFDLSEDCKNVAKSDEAIAIDLYKHVKGDSNTPIVATYQIEPAEGSTFADGTTAAKTYTTRTDGKAEVKADLKQGNTYVLSEVKADGYAISSNKLTFTVADDGTISGSDTSDMKINSDKVSIDLSDETIVVTVRKDPKGYQAERVYPASRLVGAEFQIKGVFADSDGKVETRTFTTALAGDHAEFVLSGVLIAGNEYEICETKAPAGFVRDTTTITFKVNKGGDIQLAKDHDSDNWSVNGVANRIDVDDAPVSLTLTKRSSAEDKTLANAVFTIKGEFQDGSTEKTLTTGSDGTATLAGQLLIGKTYTLAETTAPDGYVRVTDELTFTVQEDGTFKVVGTAPTAYSTTASEVVSFTGDVANDPTRLYIMKTDADNPGTKLSGAEYKLSGEFANSSESARSYTTNEQGLVEVDKALLKCDGTTVYTLKETTAPDGYELNTGEFKFTVSADGTVSPVASVDGYSLDADNNIQVNATDAAIHISIYKNGDDGTKGLTGALYTIKASGDIDSAINGVIGAEYTDQTAEQIAQLRLRQNGYYSITETTAPEGYELLGATVYFTIGTDGNIKKVDPLDHVNGKVEYAGSYFTFTDVKTSITVKKVDADDATALKGGVYTVDGKEYITNEQGVIELSGLVAGRTYTLREKTAPDGYELNSAEFKFTVQDDGSIVAAEGAAVDGYSISEDGVSIVATDPAIHISLEKKGIGHDGIERDLEGALFTVRVVGGDGAFVGKTETELKNLDADAIAALKFKQGGAYSITETTAPEGYEVVGTILFSIAEDGSIQNLSVEDLNGTVSNTGSKITLTDIVTSIKLTKTAQSGDASLANAQYTLAGPTSTGNGWAWVDSREGLSTDDLEDLYFKADGKTTYTLTETRAPYGYELITKSFTFVVNTDGTVTGAKVDANGTFEADGDKIHAKDVRISLDLQKKDAAGKDLEGAEFSVTGVFADGEGNLDSEATTKTGVTVSTFSDLHFVADQSYELVETTAPEGYEVISGTFTFTVAADGTATGEKLVSNGTVEVLGTTVTATDTSFDIVLKKTGVDGAAVRGAEFTVSGYDDQIFTTGEDGTVSVHGLVAGREYTITETRAPAGYELADNSITVKAKADGTLEQVGEAVGGFTISDDGDTVVKPNEAIRLTLAKAGAAGNATDAADSLDGAVFELTGTVACADGTTKELKAERVTVSQFNELQFTAGEYTLKEVAAPEGYALDSSEFKFSVGADGKASVTQAASAYAISSDGVTLTMTDKPIEVELAKADVSSNAVAGAELTFSDQTDTTRSDIVVDLGDGTGVWASGFIGGHTYKVTETKVPAGYAALTHEVTLAVAADGTLTLTDSDPQNPQATLAGRKLTVADTQVELSITKYSAENYPETQTVLSGAVFEVSPADGSAFADGKTEAKTLDATGTDGKTSLAGQLVVGNTYVLSETAAPAGYKLVSGSLTFTVAEDGSLVASDAPAAYVVNKGTVSVFAGGVLDDPTTMNVQKVDASNTGAKLSGATFKLTGAFADGTTEQTLTTEGDLGLASLSHALLVADGKTEYTLVETKAPAGYELNTSEFTFTVATDGAITPKAAADGYSVVDGTVTAQATDQAVEVTVNKLGENGEAIDGAMFKIEAVGGTTFADGTTAAREFTAAGGTYTSTADLVAGGTYKISETRAPEGYKRLSESLEFTVAEDGTVAAVSAVDGWAIADGVAINATDQTIDLTVSKSAADGTKAELADAAAMAGAEFSVTGTFANEASESTRTMTVGSDGTASLVGQLVYGRTYKVSETRAPAGFKLLEGELSISVSEDGGIAVEGTAPAGWSIDGNKTQVNAVDESTSIDLRKVDADDAEAILAGAEFTLAGLFPDGQGGSAEGTLAITTVSGEPMKIEGLIAGETYTLTETKAPAGYELDSTPTTFIVAADGTVKVSSGNATASDDGLTLTASDKVTELKVTKSASDGAAVSAMAGAEFSVTGVFADAADGAESTETLTIGENGATDVLAGKLVVGNEYVISETKPAAGYMAIDGQVTVVVQPDGTLAVAEGTETAAGFAIAASEDGVAVVTAVDDPITLVLTKSGTDGAEAAAMAGATFRISGTFAGESAGSQSIEVVCGEDGRASVSAQLVAGETYTVEETLAPVGYELIRGTLSFTISEDGRALASSEFVGEDSDLVGIATATDDEGLPLIAIDAADVPVSFFVKKVDASGKSLVGAVFKVESADGGEAYQKTLEVGSDGVATLDAELVAGRTYKVSELSAPKGYKLADGSFTFTVNSDGTIKKVASLGVAAQSGSAYQLSDDACGVVVTDETIAATLTKVSASDASKVLAGAEFTLSGVFADGTGKASAGTRTVVSTDGKVDLEGLVAGETYTLTETRAPEGYVRISGVLTFTVGTDGKLTLSAGGYSGGEYRLASDGLGIVAADSVDDTEDANSRKHRGDGSGDEDGRNGSNGSSASNGSKGSGNGTPSTGDVAFLGTGVMAVAGAALVARSLRRRRDEE